MTATQQSSRRDCQRQVDAIFDLYGPEVILAALAERIQGEAAIAHGEGRPSDGRKWAALAEELKQIEVPHGD